MGKLRDKILTLSDIQKELVNVPLWDAVIEVRSITAAQRARLFKQTADASGRVDLERLYPDLVIASCYDPETGEPIFEAPDREMLAGKNAAALETLVQVAMRLSGIQSGAVETATKN